MYLNKIRYGYVENIYINYMYDYKDKKLNRRLTKSQVIIKALQPNY